MIKTQPIAPKNLLPIFCRLDLPSKMKRRLGQIVRGWLIRYLEYAGFRCVPLRTALRELQAAQPAQPDRGWVLEARLAMLHARRAGDVFFVQVGSFDGYSDDLLHRHIKRFQWSGLVVEPQKAAFAELQKTYGENAGIQFACCAVGGETGELVL